MAEEAIAISEKLGYTVVLKMISPDISHKSVISGVVMDLQNNELVSNACDQIIRAVHEKRPDTHVESVAVQKMIKVSDSIELILGSKKDAVFGTIVMVGLGGTAAKLFNDQALGLRR